MFRKSSFAALLLIMSVVLLQLGYPASMSGAPISSSGTIKYSTIFDSCENLSTSNGDWSFDSRYENLTIDRQNMVEGSGSFRIDVGNGTTWNAWMYKRPNAAATWNWNLSMMPEIVFRIFPVSKIPSGGIEFQLVTTDDGGWNVHRYSLNNLTVDQWNTVEIDLRRDDGGFVTDDALQRSGQMAIVAYLNLASFTYYLDYFELVPLPSLPKGFLEAHTYVNGTEVPSVIAVEGTGAYVSPFKRTLNAGNYTVNAYYQRQKITRTISILAGQTYALVLSWNRLQSTNLTQLHTDGTSIKDSFGNVVRFGGVCHLGFLDDPAGWWTNYNTWEPQEIRRDLEMMSVWGINVIRTSISIEWWIRDNVTFYGVNYSYRQNLKTYIQLAYEKGIYVLIVPHIVLGINSPGVRLQALPFPPYISPDESIVLPSEQAFVDFWTGLASELKDYPNVIFELWNEPHNTAESGRTDSQAMSDWFRVAQQSVNAIRQKTNKIVVVQWGYCWDVGWVEQYQLSGGNIVYSGHIYRYHGSMSNGEYKYDDVRRVMSEQLKYDYVTKTLNLTVLVGETGAALGIPEQDEELECFNNTLSILNQWGIGYDGFWWRADGIFKLLISRLSLIPSKSGVILINSIATQT